VTSQTGLSTVPIVVTGRHFGRVPTWLMQCGVSSRALQVYAVITTYIDVNDVAKGCWPSKRTLAAACRCSQSTLRRAMQELKSLGALDELPRLRADGSHTSNRILLMPEPALRLE
jgi:hypothetical protein